MNIFVLEDSFHRICFFREALPLLYGNCSISLAETVDSAKVILDPGREFDVMYLDHDLGDQQFVSSKEYNTGYTVAQLIVERGIKSKEIYIHSMNPDGAENIASLLPGAVKIPYPTLIRSIILTIKNKGLTPPRLRFLQ